MQVQEGPEAVGVSLLCWIGGMTSRWGRGGEGGKMEAGGQRGCRNGRAGGAWEGKEGEGGGRAVGVEPLLLVWRTDLKVRYLTRQRGGRVKRETGGGRARARMEVGEARGKRFGVNGGGREGGEIGGGGRASVLLLLAAPPVAGCN